MSPVCGSGKRVNKRSPPTSGFLLFIPESDVHVLDMSVEDAAKLIISAGLVYPGRTKGPDRPVQENIDGRSTVS